MLDPGRGEHLVTDGAAGSEDERQLDNLVEKWGFNLCPIMGTGSTRSAMPRHIDSLDDSSTAFGKHPQPVDRGHGARRLAGFPCLAWSACLLASPGAAPKPRDQAANYHINLIQYYI
jgi:hypothetical protein